MTVTPTTSSPAARVHFWLADMDGCGYYRGILPFRQLRARGHQVTASEALDDRQFDGTVVGQRVCKIRPSTIWQRMANHRHNRLVYEVDDDLWNIDPTNDSPYYFFTHPEIAENLETNIRAAHMVTCSTEPLAEQLRKRHDNVHVLPNCIDADVLTLPRPVMTLNGPDGPVDTSQYVTVGYTSSPTHQMDFATVADHLTLLAERDQRIVYIWMGQKYDLPVRQVHVGWAQIGPEYYRRLNFDIGIAPLANHPFNFSKSGVKCVEYAAAGIPVVASDLEPYREIVEHGKTGFLAKNPRQFYKYLQQLVNDQPLRVEMGYRARQAAKRWTIQEHVDLWEKAYGLETPT